MSVGYTLGAMSFAILCSVIWLVLGNSLMSAVTLYLISGQCAMLAVIGRAFLRYRRSQNANA